MRRSLHAACGLAYPAANNSDLSQVADKLASAKRAVYRGLGISVQLPWTFPIGRLVLVVDLFSGFGGTALALANLGAQFILFSCDKDVQAANCLLHNFPAAVHVSDVFQVHGGLFAKVLAKREFAAVLVGGGSPCQGNSWLNASRKGWDDPRTKLALEIVRIADEIRALPECGETPVLHWLEMVGSAPGDVVTKYTKALRSPPLLIDAAKFGLVHRRRFFWLCGPSGSALAKNLALPEGVRMSWTPPVPSIKYVGKPIPSKPALKNGFRLAFDLQEVVDANGEGAMHVFTRDFLHPGDRGAGCSKGAIERFWLDGCRFPEPAYEPNSCLWKQDVARQPDSSERLSLHGFPEGCLEHAVEPSKPWSEQESVRNSSVGNGFHLPSIMLALIILAQSASSCVVPRPFYGLHESRLRRCVKGTILQPGLAASFPGLITRNELCADLQCMFGQLEVPSSVWGALHSSLACADLVPLQLYWVDSQLRNRDPLQQGPDWACQRQRAMLASASGEQRAVSSSKRGLDP